MLIFNDVWKVLHIEINLIFACSNLDYYVTWKDKKNVFSATCIVMFFEKHGQPKFFNIVQFGKKLEEQDIK